MKYEGSFESCNLYTAIVKKQGEYLLRQKFRLISVSGIHEKKTLCYGFFPDHLSFVKGGHTVELDACVAVYNGEVCNGELDGIAHPILFV